MKFNCGPTPEQRAKARMERLTNWHPYFCLWPRRIGPNDCRWLETVQRKLTFKKYVGTRSVLRWTAAEYRA